MTNSPESTPQQPRIAIVGSGFSGLCLGIHLKQAGIDSFTIFEKADRIGGTWRENTYPGAECDVPSALYSFSFERNPRWTHKWSEQPEILRYMEHCASKYGLNPHIRFNCEVRESRFRRSCRRMDHRDRRRQERALQPARQRRRPASQTAIPRHSRPGSLPWRFVPFRALEPRFPARGQARRLHRQRRQRHPVHPPDRSEGRPPLRFPAHRQLDPSQK
jgi:phytoene dehydrogenase-like protein